MAEAAEAKPPKRKHHPWSLDAMLLSEVEKRPCLYDRSNEDFTNHDLRKEIWKEIGDIVGFTDVETKQRYRHIRDSFTKRLRRARSNPKTLRPPFKYRLANNLKFLLPHLHFGELSFILEDEDGQRNKRKRSEEDENEELLSAVSVMIEDEDQEGGDKAPSPTHVHDHDTVERRRPTCSNQSDDPVYVVTHGHAPRADELDTFFDTIRATVRKLPPVLQSQLKFQIMEMVYKTEMGHLANSENE